jgi:tetratricopeptide (TPR) repeat protein
MAKKRRPVPRAASRKKPARAVKPATVKRVRRPARAPEPAAPAAAVEPSLVSHLEAIALYERGLKALQLKRYAEASTLLRSVIEGYPDEKELHERAQIYLAVCRRQVVPPDATPTTFDERVYAATLAINAGNFAEGLRRLQELAAESPEDDYLHYMMAVALAQRGELHAAMEHLHRAVALNPDTRFLARQDGDLEPLRKESQFRHVLDRPAAFRRERRATLRGRSVS